MTRDVVLSTLREAKDTWLSGEELAARLHVTRAAVWKAIQQLRSQGCEIESVTNRGYRLKAEGDVLNEEGIRAYLKHGALRLHVYDTITSTNTALKTLANQDEPGGLALLAVRQTEGRGRRGRTFFSPADSGLYLSLLLRPSLTPDRATRLTACAAVAAAEAIEEMSGEKADIKWVNDIFLNGRKVCGILTEAGMDFESGQLSYVIIGIGINLRTPEDSFPSEIQETAGSVFGARKVPEIRNRMAALVLDKLMDFAADPDADAVFEAYRSRSLALGKEIRILSPGRDAVSAKALDLNRDYSLLTELPDGSRVSLNSGEISIRIS